MDSGAVTVETRVALRGRLDAAGIPAARATLHEALRTGSGDVVVDLSELESTGAAGLGMLLATHRLARRDGRRLVLTGASAPVAGMLRRTRLDLVLTVDDDVRADRPGVATLTAAKAAVRR